MKQIYMRDILKRMKVPEGIVESEDDSTNKWGWIKPEELLDEFNLPTPCDATWEHMLMISRHVRQIPIVTFTESHSTVGIYGVVFKGELIGTKMTTYDGDDAKYEWIDEIVQQKLYDFLLEWMVSIYKQKKMHTPMDNDDFLDVNDLVYLIANRENGEVCSCVSEMMKEAQENVPAY